MTLYAMRRGAVPGDGAFSDVLHPATSLPLPLVFGTCPCLTNLDPRIAPGPCILGGPQAGSRSSMRIIKT